MGNSRVNRSLQWFKEIFGLVHQTKIKGGSEGFLGIYINKIMASLAIILAGLILLSFSYLWVIYNAAIIGALLGLAQCPPLILLVGVLPHGIIEFSSQFLAAAIGASLGHYVYQRFRHRTQTPFSNVLKNAAVDSILQAVIPLFFAALIEYYITPILMKSFLH